jgi:hypothetical protein
MQKTIKNLIRENKLLAILASLTIITGLTAVTIQVIDKNQIERMQMSENVSFNVTSQNGTINETNFRVKTGNHLEFGEMPQGTNQTRFINLTTDHATIARARIEGNASEYLYFKDTIAYQGQKELEVKLNAEDIGYYEGKFIVDFQAPKTRYALKWMDIKYRYLY